MPHGVRRLAGPPPSAIAVPSWPFRPPGVSRSTPSTGTALDRRWGHGGPLARGSSAMPGQSPVSRARCRPSSRKAGALARACTGSGPGRERTAGPACAPRSPGTPCHFDAGSTPAPYGTPRPPAPGPAPAGLEPGHALQRETLPLADRARLQRPARGEPGLEHIETGVPVRLDQLTVLRPDDGAPAGEAAGEFAGRRAGHPGLAPWCAGCGHAEPPGERPPHADRHPGAAHRRPCPARRWPPSAGRLQCQQAVPGARAVGRRRLVA